MKFVHGFLFCLSLMHSWIRIGIPKADPHSADQNQCGSMQIPGSGSETLLCKYRYFYALFTSLGSSVVDPDPDPYWIRIQSG
jgi:hypothetical protein